jgi:CTP:molybdopterin cytidylyltransferase MocA
MGRDKALLPWPPASANAKPSAGPQSTILSSAIQAFLGFCDITIVVAGRNEPALRPVVYACGASIICNPAPERGQFSSMQTGLQEVLNLGRDSAMITLIDRPPPRSETLNALVNAFASREHGVWAIVPEHGGQHGHPILIGREMMEAFLRAPATGNAREVEHANQDRIRYVPVKDAFVRTNIDTPTDYATLQSGI